MSSCKDFYTIVHAFRKLTPFWLLDSPLTLQLPEKETKNMVLSHIKILGYLKLLLGKWTFSPCFSLESCWSFCFSHLSISFRVLSLIIFIRKVFFCHIAQVSTFCSYSSFFSEFPFLLNSVYNSVFNVWKFQTLISQISLLFPFKIFKIFHHWMKKSQLSAWNKIRLGSQIKPHAKINSSWSMEL